MVGFSYSCVSRNCYHVFLQLVSSRGTDFRTSFSRLGGLRALTAAPFMALTASAPPEIEGTIVSSLHLKEPVVVKRRLDRPNIYLSTSKSVGIKASLYAIG